MQILGLVLLALVAVFAFFGLGERLFRRIGLPDWLAFLLVFAFVIGAVVPEIPIGERIRLNVGGFIMPIAFAVILLSVSSVKRDVLRAIIGVIAVGGITIAARMLIRPELNGLFFATAVITGLLGGMTAYLSGGGRVATLTAATLGIVLGDTANNLILRYVYGFHVRLGSNGIFDAIILACVTGIVILEMIEGIKRAMNRRRTARLVLNTEASEDNLIENQRKAKQDHRDERLFDYFEDDTD